MNDQKIHRLYDPVLKKAMKEIEKILIKHDIAGDVFLCSKTHAENRLFPSPSWSLLFFEKNEQGIPVHLRFRSKKENFASKDAQKEATEKTCHIVFQLRDFAAREFMFFDKLADGIQEKIHVDHKSMKGYIAHRDIMDEE